MANGWSPERQARQAKLIRQWRPWEKSTGPRTQAVLPQGVGQLRVLCFRCHGPCTRTTGNLHSRPTM